MDNRGSKSTIFESVVVKEQRVDGNRYKKINLIIFKVYSKVLRKKLFRKIVF